jgi:hypothetical protein
LATEFFVTPKAKTSPSHALPPVFVVAVMMALDAF